MKNLGLNEQLLKAIAELGFSTPTPIQEQSIPLLLNANKDYVGLAQTGTGKTAAFGLPLIQNIDTSIRQTQGIILCPTRELCLQITQELQRYGQYVQGLRTVAIYGGASITMQIKDLARGAHIIVGTPGRVLDHLSRGTMGLSSVRIVVLDEADQMLDMGFLHDIESIVSNAPKIRKVWLFSATMSDTVEKVIKRYMIEPARVTIGTRNTSATAIEHQYCVVNPYDKYNALRRFIDLYPDIFGIVFCRTRRDTHDLSQKLTKDGYAVDALHGDLSQAQRDAVMGKFRKKTLQLLVATDVAARGIDVNDVTHVMHYHLPEDTENYTHRSGRTARAGKSGISLALVTPRDTREIRFIERVIGKPMKEVTVPTREAIGAQHITNFIAAVKDVAIDEQVLNPYLKAITEQLSTLSQSELIKRMAAFHVQQLLARYANSPDLEAPKADQQRPYRDSGDRRQGSGFGGRSRRPSRFGGGRRPNQERRRYS
jgi:ATP-dependent RNA helicase DeaD